MITCFKIYPPLIKYPDEYKIKYPVYSPIIRTNKNKPEITACPEEQIKN